MLNAIFRNLRAAARILALLVVTVPMFAIFLLGRVLTGRSVRWRNFMVRLWAHLTAWCFSMHTTCEGPRPRGGFILVANHISYLDILLISQYVHVMFVAMTELRRWPVMGFIGEAADTIFINRRSHRDALRVVDEMDAAVRAGRGVVLFPEATASDGTDVLPFKAALLEGAARDARPVHFAVIRYRQPGVDWHGDIHLGKQFLGMIRMPRIDASLEFGGSITATDRKELTERLYEEIRRRVTEGRMA